MEAHQTAIVEIPEQSDRTGSSGYQVPNQAHARLQKLRLRRHHNRRRRTAAPYSQRSICPASPTSQRPSCACDLECSPCCIDHCLSSRLNVQTSIFAPEPRRAQLFMRRSERVHVNELGADDQEPYPKSEAQGPFGNPARSKGDEDY